MDGFTTIVDESRRHDIEPSRSQIILGHEEVHQVRPVLVSTVGGVETPQLKADVGISVLPS